MCLPIKLGDGTMSVKNFYLPNLKCQFEEDDWKNRIFFWKKT